MHPTRKRRMIGLFVILVGISIAAAITFWSLQQNMLFFVSPSDAAQQDLPEGTRFRLGGLVEVGSVDRETDGLTVRFLVTDGNEQVPVLFDGILPDLFREGQGIIARGSFNADREFVASEVLAKHDENYMPPEVADALEKAGHPMNKSANKAAGKSDP